MLGVFRRSGCQMTSHLDEGAFEVKLLFAPERRQHTLPTKRVPG